MMFASAAFVVTLNVVDDVRSFESCHAAVAYASGAPEVGVLRYRLSYGYARTADLRRDGTVRFTIRVDLTNVTVTLPQWSWPKETADQTRDVERFRNNVLEHERGHWLIARDYIAHRNVSEWLPQATTRAQAARHFKKYFDTIAGGLEDAQDFYDTVTNHGRTQHRAVLYGLLDGDNTVLVCHPQR